MARAIDVAITTPDPALIAASPRQRIRLSDLLPPLSWNISTQSPLEQIFTTDHFPASAAK
jgi:hypothetical protein